MQVNRKLGWALIALTLVLFGFSLLHASWTAPKPVGEPKLIAAGGGMLPLDAGGCIINANRGYGAKQAGADIRLLKSAIGLGADAIKLPLQEKDAQIFVKRQFTSDCSADNGRPLVPLSNAPEHLSAATLFVPLPAKTNIAAITQSISAQTNVIFYGDAAAVDRLKQARPKAQSFAIKSARQCVSDYRGSLLGTVPEICKNGWALLTLNDLGLTLWGWPNKFLDRMAKANTQIIIAEQVKDGEIIGLSQPEEYGEIASSYNGYIWAENIAEMGPALKR